jgi:aminoglycoside 3-N-acetyltransferase I
MKIEVIAKENIEDIIELITVFEKVFEMPAFVLPDRQHLKKLLEKENFVAIVAKENQKIIGGLTVYILEQYYSTKPLAYVYDLAVLNAFQRKGVGKELMEFVTKLCQEKGFEEVFVQAERVDEYAADFYRKTKPTKEDDVIHFSYTLK